MGSHLKSWQVYHLNPPHLLGYCSSQQTFTTHSNIFATAPTHTYSSYLLQNIVLYLFSIPISIFLLIFDFRFSFSFLFSFSFRFSFHVPSPYLTVSVSTVKSYTVRFLWELKTYIVYVGPNLVFYCSSAPQSRCDRQTDERTHGRT